MCVWNLSVKNFFYFSARPGWQVEALCFRPIPFICYQTCKHGILETNEQILMPIGTSGSQARAWNVHCGGQEVTRKWLKWKIRGEGTVHQLWASQYLGYGSPSIYITVEVWERWIPIIGGTRTVCACVQWHFDHCTRLKIDLKAWQSHCYWPVWVE